MNKHAVFLGTFIHCKSLNELEFLHNTAVAVSKKEGKIVAVAENCVAREDVVSTLLPKLGWAEADVEIVDGRAQGKERWFFPGFIDSHIHASQYPNVGLFGKTTLLDWLNTYAFRREASLSTDLRQASRVYTRVVKRTLSHGTTAAAYFATIDVDATNILADTCLRLGQRGYIGRVCMDTELSPPSYRDASAEESIKATKLCIQHCEKIDPEQKILTPILTPRFAPSCTQEILNELGILAKARDLPVQTHISENQGEIQLVGQMFPEARDYTDVYDSAGLLGEKTVLAHAIHLSDIEAEVIKARKSGISHCPVSNSSITSGECRVRWLLDQGIKVGLGTDVSGGYSPSILEAARQALLVSRHVAMKTGDERDKLSVEEVLFLATVGGAEVMAMQGKVGRFEEGMSWDAQMIEVANVSEDGNGGMGEDEDEGPVDVFGWETWDEVVQKWLFNGDERNTKMVWVRGRKVWERK